MDRIDSCGCCNDGNGIPVGKLSWSKALIPLAISFVLLASGIIFSTAELAFFEKQWLKLIWYFTAYIPVGGAVLIEGLQSIKRGSIFNEYTLMIIATIGAFFIGEYPEGVAVMLFYSVGELFQQRAVTNARKSIGALIDIRPERANVIRDDITVVVSPQDVEVGEIIEVKAGERVPLDGLLQNGISSFNTAALTGESVPRYIKEGEEVLAGMIATESLCTIIAIRPFSQSALARILEMVENASAQKSATERFITKFARIYTPIVTALAALVVVIPWILSLTTQSFIYDLDNWLYRGLVFLVISCPCALVISIPLSYFGGIGAASRHGILFKGGNYLDAIRKVDTVVMDKTGTLTQGIFGVRAVVPAKKAATTAIEPICNNSESFEGNISEKELLNIVAAVERSSIHPIAKAIVAYADSCNPYIIGSNKNIESDNENLNNRDTDIADTDISSGHIEKSIVSVKEIAGHGLEAESASMGKILVGNTKLLERYTVEYPQELRSVPQTTVLCSVNGKYIGYILVADALKEDATEAVNSLKGLGIDIVMLSGDKQQIVSEIAESLDIKRAYGDLLPEGKVKRIELLKRGFTGTIAFVGDGINDAPVLACCDIGIAMGRLGSDIAIETADIIIQTDHPSKIATAIKIGRETRNIVIQNIIFALSVKFAVMVLGAFGVATLWEAVFADVGVALLAVLNAVRIMRPV